MIDPETLLENPHKVDTRQKLIGVWTMVQLVHLKDPQNKTDDRIHQLVKDLKGIAEGLTNESMVKVIITASPTVARFLEFDPGLFPHLFSKEPILETAPQTTPIPQ